MMLTIQVVLDQLYQIRTLLRAICDRDKSIELMPLISEEFRLACGENIMLISSRGHRWLFDTNGNYEFSISIEKFDIKKIEKCILKFLKGDEDSQYEKIKEEILEIIEDKIRNVYCDDRDKDKILLGMRIIHDRLINLDWEQLGQTSNKKGK